MKDIRKDLRERLAWYDKLIADIQRDLASLQAHRGELKSLLAREEIKTRDEVTIPLQQPAENEEESA